MRMLHGARTPPTRLRLTADANGRTMEKRRGDHGKLARTGRQLPPYGEPRRFESVGEGKPQPVTPVAVQTPGCASGKLRIAVRDRGIR